MRKVTNHEIECYVNNFVNGNDSYTIEKNPIWLFWNRKAKRRCDKKHLYAVVYHADAPWDEYDEDGEIHSTIHEWYGVELHFRWDDGETEMLDVDCTEERDPDELIGLLEALRNFYWEDHGKE